MPPGQTEYSPSGIVQVKNWHVLITFVMWAVLIVMGYTTLRDDADESKRRIRDLEQRPVVTDQQYRDGQDSLKARLDRIERKLDNAEIKPKK